jgi:metaxin
VLSNDLDCLKWQAYIALHGLTGIAVRWDVSQDGALGERLPNLQIPPPVGCSGKGKLIPAHGIPAWVDTRVVASKDAFEGYNDQVTLDESRAWITLFEGHVHAALVRTCVLGFLGV